MASTDRQCQRCEDLSPSDWRHLRHVGGHVFHHQLWSGAAVGQGRPLELPHPWSTDQHCAGCPQWSLATAGSATMGVRPVGPHRGCRHPPNSLQGPAVLQCTPIPGGAQPAAPLSVPWPQATPAISSIMEEVTTYHGSASSVLSPVIYLEGRAGSQVALGPFREGFYSVPLSQIGCGVP